VLLCNEDWPSSQLARRKYPDKGQCTRQTQNRSECLQHWTRVSACHICQAVPRSIRMEPKYRSKLKENVASPTPNTICLRRIKVPRVVSSKQKVLPSLFSQNQRQHTTHLNTFKHKQIFSLSPRTALMAKYCEQTKPVSCNTPLSIIESEKNAKKWMSPVSHVTIGRYVTDIDDSADVGCSLSKLQATGTRGLGDPGH
jgi:hypothetical protein